MIKHCPNLNCQSLQFRKYGAYYRPSDGKWVKRWRCNRCKLHFSSATFQIHRTTVTRKLAFLARVSEERQRKFQSTLPKVPQVQFDDLITLEHTKCKPLAISLAVEAPSRRILGFEVSRIPASGPLAETSRRKY